MSHLINEKDLSFQLYDVLKADKLVERDRFSDHSRETFDAAIYTATTLAEKYFAPHNGAADEHEPQFDGEKVSTLPQVKEAFDHYAASGLIAAQQDYDNGGMQLPAVVAAATQSVFLSANPSTIAYPFLTTAAANVIKAFGNDQQKATFLPAMFSGKFAGTMALTEPDVGSSLGDLTTSANPTDQDHYLIKGQKMFISGGDQDLTENIVHLVLAKIKGAPPGVKGISLFIVPKRRVDTKGNSLESNDVALAGLLHKMGYRGTTSTVLNFGENNDCHGYLIGEPHQGLKYMFKMMNEARIGVGLGAAMIGYRGYLESLDYAKNRPQGRAPSNRDPLSKPAMIIEHTDVKRMLLTQKAYVEGGMSLCLYAASLVDDIETAPTQEAKQSAGALLDLLTPIVKAWPSHYGPKANDLAIQVLGGAGYTREYPVEQCYRDNRLNPIHEGTNGIQALDLLGRKLWQHEGLGLKLLGKEIRQTLQKAATQETLASHVETLGTYLQKFEAITLQLGGTLMKSGPDDTLANASLYLDAAGKVVLSWLWLRQVLTAIEKYSGSDNQEDQNFLQGKIQASQYFIQWELPKIDHQINLLGRMDDTCQAMKNDWF